MNTTYTTLENCLVNTNHTETSIKQYASTEGKLGQFSKIFESGLPDICTRNYIQCTTVLVAWVTKTARKIHESRPPQNTEHFQSNFHYFDGNSGNE